MNGRDTTVANLAEYRSREGGGPPLPPVEPPREPPHDPPDMKPRLAKVEAAVERLSGRVDGLKDSLHAMQWSLGTILTVGLVAIGWLVNVGNTRTAEVSGRLDRLLERQADSAAAANARFDRLLEQRAGQPPAPVVIQVPAPPPDRAP